MNHFVSKQLSLYIAKDKFYQSYNGWIYDFKLHLCEFNEKYTPGNQLINIITYYQILTLRHLLHSHHMCQHLPQLLHLHHHHQLYHRRCHQRLFLQHLVQLQFQKLQSIINQNNFFRILKTCLDVITY